jgi:hypothetical protein
VRRRDPIERQHLLDGVGVAEQHHHFLQVRAGHHNPRRCGSCAARASLAQKDSKTAATGGPWRLMK